MTPTLELLEDRRLRDTGLSFALDAARTLTITATPAADVVTVRGYRHYVQVITPAGAQTVAASKYRRIVLDAGAGNDTVRLRGIFTKSVTILGGPGRHRIANDADAAVGFKPFVASTGTRGFISGINTHPSQPPIVLGEWISRANFSFHGGSGNDVFSGVNIKGGDGPSDTIDGGDGIDRLQGTPPVMPTYLRRDAANASLAFVSDDALAFDGVSVPGIEYFVVPHVRLKPLRGGLAALQVGYDDQTVYIAIDRE